MNKTHLYVKNKIGGCHNPYHHKFKKFGTPYVAFYHHHAKSALHNIHKDKSYAKETTFWHTTYTIYHAYVVKT